MSLEFVSTMSLEFFVNYVLDWFSADKLQGYQQVVFSTFYRIR